MQFAPQVDHGEQVNPDILIIEFAHNLATTHNFNPTPLNAKEVIPSARDNPGGIRFQKNNLLGDLHRWDLALRKANALFKSNSAKDAPVSRAGEWMLDNFYIVKQTLRQIAEDLPASYLNELPKLSGTALQGHSRIFSLAQAWIGYNQSQIDLSHTAAFLVAYQQVTPLTIGELWALPVMLRIGILEQLVYAAAKLTGMEKPSGLSQIQPPSVEGPVGHSPQDFDWQNWSAARAGTGTNSNTGNGTRAQYASAEDMEDLFGSDSPYSDFFSSLFGQAPRSGRGQAAQPPRPRPGRDVEYEVDLTLEEAFHGAERLLEIEGHRIKAGIPAGVRTGSRVRLAGQGEPGISPQPAGDLYLNVSVMPNQICERDGDTLHMEIPVDFFTAITGGEIQVSSLERPLILKIPPLTNAGQSFRLRGKGMPHLGDPKTRGDLFAMVRLVLPEHLTVEELETIRELTLSRSARIKANLEEIKI